MNPIGLPSTVKAKIKPLIGFTIDIKCEAKLDMMYLARDRPKMIAKVKTNRPGGGDPGNKGMRQLCEALRNSKGTKQMVLDIHWFPPQQLRILTKWLKTSRNLQTFTLKFAWGRDNPPKGLIEILKNVKNVKNLSSLTLDMLKNNPVFRRLRVKPFMKLHHLCDLKKLKISANNREFHNSMQSIAIIESIKGLDQLCELDLDLSFLSQLPEVEIQRFIKYLKQIKNLTSLRLDSRYYEAPRDPLAVELASYLSSMQKLESFSLIFSTFPNILLGDIEKFIASVKKNNLGLKTLVLLTAQRSSWKTLQCLKLTPLKQITSLKLTLSASSKILSDRLLEDTAETLKQNPLLEKLDLELFLKPLTLQGFKLLCGNLQNLKNLSSLRLSLSQTLDSSDTEHIEDLTRSLKSLKKLTSLHISFNACSLSSKSVARIAESVDSLQDLKTLYLDFGHPPAQFLDFLSFFKKTGLGKFGPVFEKHKSLCSISLLIPGLKPSDQELEDLALGIRALKTLKSFELSSSHICSGLNNLYQSFTANPALSELILEFQEMKHQDLENLFGILQKAKNLKRLELEYTAQSLSEKAIDNFNKMIQGLTSLSVMNLGVYWEEKVEMNMILKFYSGMKYFDHFVNCSWKCLGRNRQDFEKCENVLLQNSSYIKPFSSPIRYRSFSLSNLYE